MSVSFPVMEAPAPQPSLAADFDRWAAYFDREPNPLLVLEERHLAPILPELRGCDVLDAGCGTGRWLHHCAAKRPASLTGVDISAAMLERAGQKLGSVAKLHCTMGSTLPVADTSMDVILVSFVLSYMESVDAFAKECERVTRPGATVVLSDMHPATAAARGWKRTFHEGNESVELKSHPHSVDRILAAFRRHGFELLDQLEPSFAEPEREFFTAAGRVAEFDALATLPAIYILKLARITPARKPFAGPATTIHLTGARYALGPLAFCSGTVSIRDKRIASLARVTSSSGNVLDLSGYLVLPGLVNAHDHLEFALFPNLGRPSDVDPYANASEWAQEIHNTHADLITLHRAVPRETCLWWGAVRNLLCGVTSVCHHNEIYPLLREPAFPVRVVTGFGWAHSLAWEPAIEERSRTTPAGQPFILHAGEGTDIASAEEFIKLDRMGLLNERTILVHGLSLTTENVGLLNSRGSSLVTCPTSNRYLFHQLPTASLLSSVRNVALGSDSPLTAKGDLLDEIQCLHREVGLPPHTIYQMVTTQPAQMLRLNGGEGRIGQDFVADLIAVVGRQDTPAAVLADLGYEQVELVIVGGRVQLASSAIYARLPEELRDGLEPMSIDGIRRWLRAPVADLIRVATQVLGGNPLQLGGKQVSLATPL